MAAVWPSVQPCRACDNPFATDRVTNLRFRPQATTWEELLASLERLRFRATIVGPRGSGKTTLLQGLARPLADRGLEPCTVSLPADCRRPLRHACAQLPRPLSAHQVLLVDGTEQLDGVSWVLFRLRCRSAGGLVATAHRAGRLPILLRCETSPHVLRELVDELAPGEIASLEPVLDALHRRHQGDLRRCLLELYDLYAGRRSLGDLQPGRELWARLDWPAGRR
jgi:hypothetical protein